MDSKEEAMDPADEIARLNAVIEHLTDGEIDVIYRVVRQGQGRSYPESPVKKLATARSRLQFARRNGREAHIERGTIEWTRLPD